MTFDWNKKNDPLALWDGEKEALAAPVSALDILRAPHGHHIERDLMPAICRSLAELCERADAMVIKPPHILNVIGLLFDPKLERIIKPRRKLVGNIGFDVFVGGAGLRDFAARVKSIDMATDLETGGIKIEVRYK